MARAYIELPQDWGPGRLIIAEFQRAGYECEERRRLSTGERILVLRGGPQLPGKQRAQER